jgi:hypothetical protein
MKKTNDKLRVLIAITESSPVSALWRAALNLLSESPAELVALFVDDERWRRAASLPFTREISRIGGTEADFTVQRAEQVYREAIRRMQQRIEELASKADLAFGFEVLSEFDQKRIQELVGKGQNVLIAPSFIRTRPIYTHLTRLDCRIHLIDVVEESERNEEDWTA